jgi:hypothetical protein
MTSDKNLCKYEGSSVLLVEGKNDCHVIGHLWSKHAASMPFKLYACGSDDQVLKRLNALIPAEGTQRVGVVLDVDIDTGLANRWRSIRDKLAKYPYALPASPDPSGTIIKAQDVYPRVGVWLMPNNREIGMIEDFCLEMIEEKALGVAHAAVQNAKTAGVCTFKDVHHSKAVVHTYLAWQHEPGYPLGQAIKSKALRHDTETAGAFINWLNLLFNSD